MTIMVNLLRAPLTALSAESKHLISTLLNPTRVIPGRSGLLRDWRGFAQICSITGEIMPAIASDPDPFNRILGIVQKRSQNFTLQNLREALEKIERWDIVDDSESYLARDADLYLERLGKSETAAEENNFVADAEILTLDDQFRIERGEDKQHYDAFLLYADEDMEFVNQVIENLEKKNNLKLCIKERDLIAGITFEHEAIMKLISERCNRLIAIISPDFLKSPANKFFLNFAQAIGIDKRQERKIIPCVYKDCPLPPQLTYFSKIYYNKSAADFFWDKFARSMKAVPQVTNVQKSAELPNKKLSFSIKKENGFTQQYSEQSDCIKENSSEESSKSSDSVVSRSSLRCLIKKPSLKLGKLSNSGEKSQATELIPNLPSLDGWNSSASIVPSKNTVTKSKKERNIFKKVQSIIKS